MRPGALNDPELVRREYADESGLSARIAAQESATGPDPRQVAFEAVVGDVQALPFVPGRFDCVLAAWMLYHVPDLDLALRELRRVLTPHGRLVAVTNSEHTLPELWELVGYDGARAEGFSAESGQGPLLRHFTIVERRDVRGTVTFPDREAAYAYVAASPTRSHLAEALPFFEGPLQASRHVVVFVCQP